MKKPLLLMILLLLAALLLTACGTPAPVEEEPTEPAPTEAPAPTTPPVTAEPTISPRPMEGVVEWPDDPTATLLLIDPIDKPTRPPIVFEPYRTYGSPNLGISFEIPSYFGEPTGEVPNTNMIVFMEPTNDIRSGTDFATSVTISVSVMGSDQTEKDAQTHLDAVLDTLRAEHPSLQASGQAENTMMKQKGSYVTYWIDMPIDGSEELFRMRGRCLVVPNGKRLYMVRFLCPSNFNGEYEEGVFKQIRKTFAEVTAVQ